MKISTRFSIKSFSFKKIILQLVVILFSTSLFAQNCPQPPYNNDTALWINAYHGTMAFTTNGLEVWGDRMDPDGVTDLVSPLLVTPGNGYNYTGDILLATTGDQVGGQSDPQNFILTTFGLYVWGDQGIVIDASLTASSAFQATTMPVGVLPGDVKRMKASRGVIALLTNSGEVYVRASTSNSVQVENEIYGDGSFALNTAWHQTDFSAFTPTPVIESIKVSEDAIFAFSSTGDFFTWGSEIREGDGTGVAASGTPYLMTSPFPGTVPSMISLTTETEPAYFALNPSDGFLYSLGENGDGQLGIGNTTDQASWQIVQNALPGTGNLANVTFVDAVDNSDGHGGVGAITADGTAYLWGDNNTNMLSDAAAQGGGFSGAPQTLPIVPSGFNAGTDVAVYMELSGHFSLIQIEGQSVPCFVGHHFEGNKGDGTISGTNEDSLNCSVIPDEDFCVSLPTIVAQDDDFSVTPFNSAGGTTTNKP